MASQEEAVCYLESVVRGYHIYKKVEGDNLKFHNIYSYRDNEKGKEKVGYEKASKDMSESTEMYTDH